MPSSFTRRSLAARCREGSTNPTGPISSRLERVTLSATERPSARPSPFRSSLSIPTLCARSAGGEGPAERQAATFTLPRRTGESPKIARRSSVRPAPTSPATPRISPRRKARRAPMGLRSAGEFSTSRRSRLGRARGPREELRRRRGRPSSRGARASVTPATSPLPTVLPSRSTVKLRAMRRPPRGSARCRGSSCLPRRASGAVRRVGRCPLPRGCSWARRG